MLILWTINANINSQLSTPNLGGLHTPTPPTRYATLLRLFPRGVLRTLHAGEIAHEKTAGFSTSCSYLCGGFNVEVTQNLSPMATAHYTPTHCPDTGRKFTRAERKAANKAKFKAELKASTPKRKQASKPAKAATPTKASLMRLTKAQLVDLLLATPAKAEAAKPKRKPKRKSAPKVRKATPSERVADRQARTYHGRPDTPVTPQAEAHTADVDAARKAARETGARNRKRQAFDLATMWAFSESHGGVYTDGQQAELTRLLGSADVSTYADVVALTH